MLTVACVLRSGGIYDAGWVARLKAGVDRHLWVPHRFVCFSDVDVPCSRIPLEHDWPGWWAKLEAFRMPGPVLFFDLDTAIVGDLKDIAAVAAQSEFVMLRDFYAPDHCGSGVMGWSGSAPSFLYRYFASDADNLMAAQRQRMGDQALIEDAFGRDKITRWQDAVQGQICSFKVHCANNIVPEDTRVVCFHGQPKPFDLSFLTS